MLMLKFQSHAGSIEAVLSDQACGKRSAGFNPTLVRLRPCSDIWAVGFSSRFNPTLVRLRPFLRNGDEVRVIKFQSHAGSIEAPLPRRGLPGRGPGFQSHAGSIEAGCL